MDLLNKLAVFYSQNKDAIQLLVAVVIYVIAHRQAVFVYARKKAGTLMLSAEKGAQDLLLNSGAEKMDWVVQKAYQKMPAFVRMVVSMDQFRTIAQDVYNEAKLLLEQHKPTVSQPAQSPAATSGAANGGV